MIDRCSRVVGFVAFAAFALSWATARAQESKPPEGLRVYLVTGDWAPMAKSGGAAWPDADPRCYVYVEGDGWRKIGELAEDQPAEENVAALQVGITFANAMLGEADAGPVGLILHSPKRTFMEDWFYKSDVYRGARRQFSKATPGGKLDGVLWMHAHTQSETALSSLKNVVANLRMDTERLNLPVVVAEVPGKASGNSLSNALVEDVHATAIARLGDTDDELPGLEVVGQTLVSQMQRLHQAEREKDAVSRPRDLIDTHVHPFANKPGGLDAMAKWMDANHISHAIVHPLRQSKATAEQREVMLANFEKYAGRIHRFCIIFPEEVETAEEAVAILEEEKASGAIGFGEHYGKGQMFDDPKNLLIYEACERVGLPVMFHIDSGQNMDEKGLPRVERVLKQFPDLVLIAHAYWWLHLPEGTCDRLMRDYPNLYADVSGKRVAAVLNRDRKYAKEFLTRHADRILFGSDAGWWSWSGDEPQFELFEEIDLPQDVRDKIYRENAKRLFGFEDASK